MKDFGKNSRSNALHIHALYTENKKWPRSWHRLINRNVKGDCESSICLFMG